MPYFNWQGVTLTGKIKRGKLFSRTQQELDVTLLKRDVALLNCSATPSSSVWSGAILVSTKIQFFRQLAALLRAGILLPDALIMVTEQLDHPAFQEIIYGVGAQVDQGASLSDAMLLHPQAFDALMIHTIHVGHQAGALATALQMLADYVESVESFRKKIRSASLMPALTLVFFCIVALAIFIGIIPRFKHIFDAAHHEIPSITRLLLQVSDNLSGWAWLALVGAWFGLWALIKIYMRSTTGRKMIDRFVLHLPVISGIVRDNNMMTMMRSMAILLDAGTPLLFSLRTARETVTNHVLQEHMHYLEHNVASGSSLSQAMAQHPEHLFEQAIISMIHVGQESGQLSAMLRAVADRYQDSAHRSLAVCTTLFQPLLMVILGLLIAGLVFAVYLPIFNMANVL